MKLTNRSCVPRKTFYRYQPVILDYVRILFKEEQQRLIDIIKDKGGPSLE